MGVGAAVVSADWVALISLWEAPTDILEDYSSDEQPFLHESRFKNLKKSTRASSQVIIIKVVLFFKKSLH
jgi:hypothetical protein